MRPYLMTYSDAVAYLDSLAQFGWKLDLARIERLCELAEHPERRFPSVLVAGSAGKGSTCALLGSILQAAGLRIGTSPKPHLFSHRERAQINGEPISEGRFAALMTRIQPLAQQVTREEGSPTVFEVLTLLILLYFAEERVDRGVVEVGLGGRFDATNVLTPDVSVITMIGLDHTDRLGDTVEKIAFEKAGIIKPGKPVVSGAEGGALRVIEEAAADRGTDVWRLGHELQLSNVRTEQTGTWFDLRTPAGDLRDLSIQLVGEHQARNAAVAAGAALRLPDPPPEAAIRRGLESARIAGRLQLAGERPLLLLDAAHSPDRADALALALRTLYLPAEADRRLILVIGCSQGHAPEVVVSRLAPLAAEVIATRSSHTAAVPAAEIAEAARAAGVPVEEREPVGTAVGEAQRRARPQDLVLVTGSIFAVAEALAALHAAGADA